MRSAIIGYGGRQACTCQISASAAERLHQDRGLCPQRQLDMYGRTISYSIPAGSIRSGRVIDVLARLISVYGAPSYLRSDSVLETASRAVLNWLLAEGIHSAMIDSGKPWQSGTAESYDGKFRDQCLPMKWCRLRAEARTVVETFRRSYNTVRQRSNLEQKTLKEIKRAIESTKEMRTNSKF